MHLRLRSFSLSLAPFLLPLLLVCVAAPARAQGVPQQSIHPGLEGQALIDALQADYAPTQTLGYGPARDTLYAYEQRTDGALIGEYTGFSIQLDPGADPSYDAYLKGINAEHTFPQSKGAGSEPAKSDLHNLFPVKSNVNSSRSNHPYAEIADSETDTWYYLGQDQSSTPTSNIDRWSERDGTHPDPAYSARFEPREDHAGDAARAAFYFYVLYQSQADGAFFEVQKDALLRWHSQDAVDQEEYDRSAFIASKQGTANPFILDTTLARRAFGSPSGGGDEPPAIADGVWINEIHYDNDSYDSGEGIEIAGPAGADLSGWSLALYNGNGSSVYETISLSGSIDDEGSGTGALWFGESGVQNGSPDGIALVSGAGDVVQFLSYEGTLTASDGPAAGLTSTDIGVEESSSTPAGSSLQLTGSGSAYADFTWGGPSAASTGQINAGQTISPSPSEAVAWINELHYDNDSYDTGQGVEVAGEAGADLSRWSLALYNGNGSSVYETVSLSGTLSDQEGGYGTAWFSATLQNGAPDGVALVNGAGEVVQFISYEGTLTASGGPAAGLTSTDIGVEETSSTPAGYSLALSGSGTSYADFTWEPPAPATGGQPNGGQTFGDGSGGSEPVAWVNEIHYDNKGGDTGEGFEIAGTAGLDLSGWSAALYNGSGGGVYETVALSGTLSDQEGGFGLKWFAENGLQNGAPDGIALVNGEGEVVQFLSYEGTLEATSGPAAGLTSTDIGQSEDAAKKNRSLQLAGTGAVYGDFTWEGPKKETRGAPNRGQTLTSGSPATASSGKQAGDYVEEGKPSEPSLHLSPPHPNPARETAHLSVTSREGATTVRVEVFDALGRRVETLHDGPVPAGRSLNLVFDGAGRASGLYLIRATSGRGRVQTRTVVLVR